MKFWQRVLGWKGNEKERWEKQHTAPLRRIQDRILLRPDVATDSPFSTRATTPLLLEHFDRGCADGGITVRHQIHFLF